MKPIRQIKSDIFFSYKQTIFSKIINHCRQTVEKSKVPKLIEKVLKIHILTAMVFILPETSKSGKLSYQEDKLRLTNSVKLVGRSS